MQELNMVEVEQIGGGEAGVPHSDYYYGDDNGLGFWDRLFYYSADTRIKAF